MTPAFYYDDIVRVQDSAGLAGRAGQRAWIVGVFTERPEGDYFARFPPGVVYSVEFDDGSSAELHEDDLALLDKAPAGRHA
ncbi:MAG: hypothetical protein ACXU8N_10445 [Telluria sp.]